MPVPSGTGVRNPWRGDDSASTNRRRAAPDDPVLGQHHTAKPAMSLTHRRLDAVDRPQRLLARKARGAVERVQGAWVSTQAPWYSHLGGIGALDDFLMPRPEFTDCRRGGRDLMATDSENTHDEGEQAAHVL